MKQDPIGICGGGVIGLLLARMLADLGLQVVVFAKDAPGGQPMPMVHALNAVAVSLLQQCGVWDHLPVATMRTMQVCDQQHQFNWMFSNEDLHQPALGYIASVHDLQQLLYQQCQQHRHIDIRLGALSQSIVLQADGVHVTDAQGDVVHLSGLVGADGAHSWVRDQLAIGCDTIVHGQQAIVATVQLAEPCYQMAWQRFLPTGPVALLPSPVADQAALIWSLEQGQAQVHMQQSDADFCLALQTALGDRFGTVKLLSKRFSRPLVTQVAQKFYGPNSLLIGDAAHTMLPLLGQGANLGCLDIASLLNLVRVAQAQGQPMWSMPILKAYERERRLDCLLLGRVAQAINESTCWQNTWGAELRGWLGQTVLSVPMIKRGLMRYAIGARFAEDDGAVPRLFQWTAY